MRNKIAIALVAFAMVTVFLPNAVTQVNPDWEDPDGWGADNYVTPEPNFGDEDRESFDYDSSRMWQEAPTFDVLADENGEIQDRIYYDMVIDTSYFDGLPGYKDEDVSPRTYPITSYYSYLGFWRDCNGDSFIGDLDTLQMQYLNEGSDIDENLCPPPGEDANDRDRFFNDGTQVREFVPIGPGVRDLSTADSSEIALCPDRNNGPSGDEDNEETPRSNRDAFLLQSIAGGGGGDNIYCGGERVDWVQDDFAKVWMQLLFPESAPKPTGTICVLCHDGTFRDTNGFFRWVDGNVLGMISATSFGLWPSEAQPGTSASAVSTEDPDPGQQCDPHGDPVFAESDAGPYDDSYYENEDANAATNAEAFVSRADPSGDSPASILPGCSPIPNWAYINTPVLGPVAYPGHQVEDRFNSSEEQNTMAESGFLGEPFHWQPENKEDRDSDHCKLNEDPSSWDGDEDADPVGGWSASDPTDFSKWYGPNDDGPSLGPTYRSVVSASTWQVEHAVWDATGGEDGGVSTDDREPKCESSGSGLQWESHAPTGQAIGLWGPGPTIQDSFFSSGTDYNPARDTGVGSTGSATDTEFCKRHPEAGLIFASADEAHRAWRCSAIWYHAGFIDVPNEQPLTRSVIRTDASTGFADVSFGDGTARAEAPTPGPHDGDSQVLFDTMGDGPFKADRDGIYDATNPPGWTDDSAWSVTLLGDDPATALPGGINDAHSFGAEGCAPSGSELLGNRTQSLAISELEAEPELEDGGELLDHPDLPDSGADYLVEPDDAPQDPESSFWLCDRDIWAIAAGHSVNVQDPNDETSVVQESTCNLWRLDNDGVPTPRFSSELNCYDEPKVGDPYDLRDFECHDNDLGMDTYEELRGTDPAIHETVMGPEGDREDSLYFDCDTPHTGVPAP